MFNRNNLPSMPSPFGARDDGSNARPPPPRDPYASSSGRGPAPPADSRRNVQTPQNMRQPQGAQHPSSLQVDGGRRSMQPPSASSYGGPAPGGGSRGMAPGSGAGTGATRSRQGASGHTLQMRPTKSPDSSYIFRNLVAVSPQDIPASRDGSDILLLLQGAYVVSARPFDGFPKGQISLSDPQRTWMGIALTDLVNVEIYDPFTSGGQAYLGSMDVEIGFAGQRRQEQQPYDQDELAKIATGLFEGQVLAPGQKILMDVRSVPLLMVVKTVQLVELTEKSSSSSPTSSDPMARGILTPHTAMNFYKDAKTPIQLRGSTKRPPPNSIIGPDFKFENMGIGGLDSEFSTIFRRGFASRIFPPGLVEKFGIQHVKGILLYGPPGTGKTLIARQIGKLLNTREPKVINGPEVLNKFVGQSEENIRKLFADAEKEYKEKGDESGLHIIIFDELDAVCKQRGSGGGGGTGVGDSVVNQLLSKLDGVDQLNNILLIGMTNRMDMIDDALLRPGRLEVHMEISLPDEEGRVQILKIQTQKMRERDVIDHDVDLEELAHLTKNFSGAELNGLVKSATSFAFNRHVKAGTMATISDDIDETKVKQEDFHNALEEVKAAFGASDDVLERCLHGGIIQYSPFIDNILAEARLFVEQVRVPDSTPLFSVLLHGSPGSGKTALAAKIAMDSEFPFIKMINPEDMVGMNEMSKVQYMSRIFMDAYKSPMSIVVMDNIERIVDWVPIGPRFSNSVLQTLMVLLSKHPPKGRRLLILATSTERSVLQQLDILKSFNSDIPVPNVNTYEELQHVMIQSGAFTEADVQKSLEELNEISQSEEVGVGIKRILLGIETAKQDADRASRFAAVMSRAIADRQYGL